MTSLEKAREFVHRKIWRKGVRCPCCDKWCKIQPRPINLNMVNGLYWIYDNTPAGGYVDVPKCGPQWMTKSNQHTTLKHWGLLERAPNTDPKKKHSGMWRVTPKGLRVMMGEPIEKYALIYNDTCYGLKGPMILLKDVRNRFDYSEFIRGTAS